MKRCGSKIIILKTTILPSNWTLSLLNLSPTLTVHLPDMNLNVILTCLSGFPNFPINTDGIANFCFHPVSPHVGFTVST
jgi:hypothetical protein